MAYTGRMLGRGLALVAVCHLAVMLGTAVADEKTGKQRADELFEEGRNLLAQENAAGACEKFNEAIKLEPEAPGTMLNLGLCNEKLKKYATALYWFRKAQAKAAETGGLEDYETAAKAHTVDLKQNKVATIKITFATPTPDAVVKIDGATILPADYLAAEVDTGEHTLVAGAPGKKNFEHRFSIAEDTRGGETITINLVEGDNFVIVDRGAGRRKAAIITAVGGGVLLLASLGVSYYAKTQYDKCASNGELKRDGNDIAPVAGCPKDTPEEAVTFANDHQKLAQVWGTSLFVAGAVTIGIASFLYFTAPEKERIDRTVFTPVLGPTEVGFSLTRGF